MATEDRSQRTEKPTPRRIQKARERGQVARSPEVSSAAVLAGFLVFAYLFGSGWLARLQAFLGASFSEVGSAGLETAALLSALGAAGAAAATLLVAPLGAIAVGGLAGNVLQGTPQFTLKPFEPKWSRLDPSQNLKKIVSIRSWVDTGKALLKAVLYAAVAGFAVRDALREASLSEPGARGALSGLFSASGTILVRIALLSAAIAVLDLLFRKWDHLRSLRMTKKEVKDERKNLEGDPLIRARIRSKQLTLARTRMMAEIPKATVVVTNPTHYAVALRYVEGETPVPKLVAKGRGKIADRIRMLAVEHRIPIVSEPPLARALFRSVPVGAEIPAALFRAVAEVLALVLRRSRPAGARP